MRGTNSCFLIFRILRSWLNSSISTSNLLHLVCLDHGYMPRPSTVTADCHPQTAHPGGRVELDPIAGVDVIQSKVETTIAAVRNVLGLGRHDLNIVWIFVC